MGSKYTTVSKIPPCDVCLTDKRQTPAYADARLQRGFHMGSWAYVCREHFNSHGCELGLGSGQVLVLPSSQRRGI